MQSLAKDRHPIQTVEYVHIIIFPECKIGGQTDQGLYFVDCDACLFRFSCFTHTWDEAVIFAGDVGTLSPGNLK